MGKLFAAEGESDMQDIALSMFRVNRTKIVGASRVFTAQFDVVDPSVEVKSSEIQLRRQVLLDQLGVKGLKFFPVGGRWAFGVEVVGIKCLHPR